MGCDGGTIPRRDELVRVKKKPEAKDKDFELAFQWRCCYLSQQVLQSPIVMCGLGHLYNKIGLIEGLLNRATLPQGVKHIKSLKDVKNLNLTPNPEYKSKDEKKEGGVDTRSAPYICPVTGLEMTGKYRFVGLWSCGCVFSERSLKEITGNVCHKCQKEYNNEDVVVLNGNEEDFVIMKKNIENRQQKQKQEREKKLAPKPATVVSKTECASTSQIKSESLPQIAPTAAFRGVVKREGSTEALKEKAKKVKKDYSVAKDPQASDVYKSIFTTHSSEKQQNRAHWITYNPFYN
uniref:Replication termination factor 2 n=1 Tax=Photinus pyralis TaxID=7054 RepID=A0A1Y1L8M5_PHOPY